MDGIRVVALEAAVKAGVADLNGAEQDLRQPKKQRHPEEHDEAEIIRPAVPGRVMSPKPVVVSAVTVK